MEEKTLAVMAAILGALKEVGPSPHSAIYLALGMNLDLCMKITSALTDAGLITVERNLVSLTEKGRVTIDKIDALNGN